MFPGIDPFIESQAWADFHHEFIVAIRDALVPSLRPSYAARIEQRVYVERAGEGVQPVIPDVTIARRAPGTSQASASTVAAPFIVPLAMPETIREPYLTVRTHPGGQLVTVLELLSPANKRIGSRGRQEYLDKRDAVLQSSVSLVELDLLRAGERLPMGAPLPTADYYVVVSRAADRPDAGVWPFTVRDPLPHVGVPLLAPDGDVPLPLQALFEQVYERAGYDYTLDHALPLHPPLPAEDEAWLAAMLT